MLDIIQFRIFCLPVCYLKIYKTIISSISHGCQTLCFTLRDEHMLNSRALRKIFGSKREEVK